MTPRDDEIIRAAMADLRSADGQDVPSFEQVRHRVRSRAITHTPWRTAALAAAAVIIVVIAARTVVGRRNRLTVPEEIVALTAWRATTDGLLDTHVKPLVSGTPRLDASLLDNALTGESK
jgi:uncharacterized protein YbjQ (UPF0145 family)